MNLDPITRLALTISKPEIGEQEKLALICRATLVVVPKANRISLWRFIKDGDAIESIVGYDHITGEFSAGLVLNKPDFRPYFDAVLKNKVLMASDARTHPATSCFNHLYFEPNNIFSLLDYIYFEDYQPAGVICCESVGKQVDWQESDVKVLKRISNMTSLFFKRAA